MGEYAICIIGLGGWTPLHLNDKFRELVLAT